MSSARTIPDSALQAMIWDMYDSVDDATTLTVLICLLIMNARPAVKGRTGATIAENPI
jgi:hypothetical protein